MSNSNCIGCPGPVSVQGTLRLRSFAARFSGPVPDVTVHITGDGLDMTVFTDADGIGPDIPVTAPAASYSLDENNTTVRPYATVDIQATASGYYPLTIRGVQIFDGQITLANLDMTPADEADPQSAAQDVILVPEHSLFAGTSGSGPEPLTVCQPRVLEQPIIPEYITVHLGKPSASAQNVTVSFRYYIANVASSEVYPTWEGYRNSQKARRSISISPSIRQLFPYPTKNRIMDPYRAIVLPPGPLSQKCRTRRYCLVLSPPISF